MKRKFAKNLLKLKSITKTQCTHGNWDIDEYMRGMANGLILAVAIMEDSEPQYFEPPVQETRCAETTNPAG